MNRKRPPPGAILTFLITVSCMPAVARATQPSAWTELGTLDCIVGPSIGLVAGARQHARCVFKRKPESSSTPYIGRLEKVGRAVGLPSGGKLIWTVFATSDAMATNLSGNYRTSGDAHDFAQRDAYTICKGSPQPTCLQPVVGEVQWKQNLAPTVSRFRLDANLRRKTSRSGVE
jgi:hypothetical protein